MYETHFGLSGRPFAIAADPDFYFANATHEHALAYLQYAALEGSSLVVVTGAIGVGKTMLVQTLQRRLDPRSIAVAQLIGPHPGADDLPRALLAAFGITPVRSQPQAALQTHLAALAADGRRALLIVDDAHGLSNGALHELLRLATPTAPAALQLALVGQPGLRGRLQQDPSDAPGHGVHVFCHLAEFELAETAAYIEHRLRRVGWEQRPAIPAPARAAIQRATGGVPLLINRLCDRLLFAACVDKLDTIPSALVERVDDELRHDFDTVQTQPATSAAAHARSAVLDPAPLSIPTLVSVIENAQPLTRIEPALYGVSATPLASRWTDDAERDEVASEATQPTRAAQPRLRKRAAGLLGAAIVAAFIGVAAYRGDAPSPPATEPASTTVTRAGVAAPPPTGQTAEPLAVETLTNASPTGAGTRAEAAGAVQGAATGEPAVPASAAAAPPDDAALAEAKPRAARSAARGMKDSFRAAPAAPPSRAASPAPGVLGPCTDAADALGLCAPPNPPDRH